MDIQVIASGSRGNCYRVSDGKTSLLLEAGINIARIKRALNFRLSDIAGVLVSHEHKDHSKACGDLIRAGIDIYTSRGTADVMELAGHRVHAIESKKQFVIRTFTVLPFDTRHDAAEPLGFLLYSKTTGEKLLFATDTYYVKYKFKGLTHVMVECNYSADILDLNIAEGNISPALKKRLIQSHFSLENVKEFLRANDLSKVKEIYLLHHSAQNIDIEQAKKEIQGITGKVVIIA
ncbi:MAG: MBL fold metallo-hydrolase [Deltaproteobacteria bacterium]|nr:MBL fold metallo-hydrolase [Deltaproteobacteria bacterium]